MPFLNHVVHLERDVDSGIEDDYEVPATTLEVGENFNASIQPKSIREVAQIAQAGANVGDWTLFVLPRRIDTSDKIVHVSEDCPIREAADLPDAVFELTGVRNAAGVGHHLEIDARLVGSPAYAVAGS